MEANSKNSGKLDKSFKINESHFEVEEEETCGKKCVSNLKENILLLLLILSIGLGVGIGIGLRDFISPNDVTLISYIRFPGEMLMRMLKMLILPLIVSSLISGLAGLDAKASGKMGGRAVLYYLTTTLFAVILGIALVLAIRPGSRGTVESSSTQVNQQKSNTADAFLDLLRNMFPDNIAVATFKSTRTIVENVTDSNGSIIFSGNSTVTRPKTTMPDGPNVLGIVVYSIALGLVVAKMGAAGRPVTRFFDALAEATMKMVGIVIWYSPVGIVFLVATEIIKMDNPIKDMQQLGLYMTTVLSGLAIHGFIVLPLIYLIACRRNPLKYLWGILQAMATAFGTASSSATLPVTYRCLEENNGIDQRVTRFVLPVGATINMDGTALYEAVAPIFIAQQSGIDLSFTQIIAISITATCASIGAASVPQAGLVTMVIVLTAANLPTDGIAKILAVDWFLDRFRTMINVMGDSIGAGIVHYLSKKELSKMRETEMTEEEGAYSNVVYDDDREMNTGL